MSVVQFNNIYKQFSGEYLLKDISFTIEDKDRIGLVGLNGTGKSTLIKMLLGMERIDPDLQNNIGNISMSNTTKVGYLSQNHNFSDEMNSVYEEMLEVFIEEHKLWHEIQKINSFLAISVASVIIVVLGLVLIYFGSTLPVFLCQLANHRAPRPE